MDSFLTLSNLFKQFQSFNQIIPAAYLKSATLNSYDQIRVKMKYTAGIDIGTAYSKGVIISNGNMLSACMLPSGRNFNAAAKKVMDKALDLAKLSPSDICSIGATGHGAKNVPFADEVISDLICAAKAVFLLFPSVVTIVDIGALSSRAMRLSENGALAKFIFSGKCAGGSGKILQVIARVLDVKLSEVGTLSLKSKNRVEFNTGCAVFMESEAVSRVAEGASREDLLAGLHHALASQICSLAERVEMEKDYLLIGGGAQDQGLVKAVNDVTGKNFMIPDNPQLIAAFGAALIAEKNNDFSKKGMEK